MTTTPYADSWVPVRREDGELIGFLSREPAGWCPRTVFGHPIGQAEDRATAEEHLHAVGMSYLAERWELLEGSEWISVELVEVSPSGVTVQLVDMGHPDRYGERQRLLAPVDGALRLR